MPSVSDTVTDLRDILARLEGVDLWPPWDAAQTIVDLVGRVLEIAGTPPGPDPEATSDAADEWHLIHRDVELAREDLSDLRSAVTPSIFAGVAGSSFRRSVGHLMTRLDTVPVAGSGVESALRRLASSMTQARSRHDQALDGVRPHLSISWSMLNPFDLRDRLTGIVGELVTGVQDLIGAYQDAAAAHADARRDIVRAMDGIDFPEHLPDNVPSVIDLVNVWEDDAGPVRGGVLDRYDGAFADLTDAERAAVRQALEDAEDDEHAGWIVAAVASGLSGPALQRYLDRLGSMTPAEREALDVTGAGYEQPDHTTCGPSSLVLSRMLNDPAYALWINTGYDAATGLTDPRSAQERFGDEAIEMHERTNGLTDRDGDLQIPYPEAIGTAPWAAANEMSAEGGSGVPGTTYGVQTIRPSDAGATYDDMARAIENGHTVPLYVGNEAAPGHIVLVTGADDTGMSVYDPASGETRSFTPEDFAAGDLPFGTPAAPLDRYGSMDTPWFVVLPE